MTDETKTVHEDVDEALQELEQQISAHVANPIFRDLALKGVDYVRDIVKAHLNF